jgi:hypothetical protein
MSDNNNKTLTITFLYSTRVLCVPDDEGRHEKAGPGNGVFVYRKMHICPCHLVYVQAVGSGAARLGFYVKLDTVFPELLLDDFDVFRPNHVYREAVRICHPHDFPYKGV